MSWKDRATVVDHAGPDLSSPGLVEKGNVDLTNRPRVKNADGSISTVRSLGVNIDGKEVLLPTVSDDGRILTKDEAVQQYRQTGKHLGVFSSVEASTSYAKKLHEDQARSLTAGSWRDRAELVKPEAPYLEDVGRSAVKEIKGIVTRLPDLATEAVKGSYAMAKAPGDIINYPVERFSGKQPSDTELGKDIQVGKDVISKGFESIKGTGRDIKDLATNPKEMFRDRPIATVATALSALIPLAKGVGAGGRAAIRAASAEAPNMVERFGARGILDSIEIRPQTIERIAGKSNPAEVGAVVGKRLVEEGAVGGSAKETFDLSKTVKNKYGDAVEESLSAIKKASKDAGIYPEGTDPLKVKANPVLRPLINKANDLRDSGYPLERTESRYHRAMYNSLSKSAEANGGFITLDNVRKEMQRVGKMFKKLAPDSDQYNMVAEVYGTLADTRDAIVNTIADRAGNPALATNLRNANQGFSLYTRLLPDIRRAAAMEATGSTGFFSEPLKAARKSFEAPLSRGAVKTGGLPRKFINDIRDIIGRSKQRIEAMPETIQSAEEEALRNASATPKAPAPGEVIDLPESTIQAPPKPAMLPPGPKRPLLLSAGQAPVSQPRLSLQEFGNSFQERTGIPSHEANRWMAAYKRDPSKAASMVADYSRKVIKNQADGRRFRLVVRSLLQQEAASVKVGGLPRKAIVKGGK